MTEHWPLSFSAEGWHHNWGLWLWQVWCTLCSTLVTSEARWLFTQTYYDTLAGTLKLNFIDSHAGQTAYSSCSLPVDSSCCRICHLIGRMLAKRDAHWHGCSSVCLRHTSDILTFDKQAVVMAVWAIHISWTSITAFSAREVLLTVLWK